jgi:hypothetical protein
MNQMDVKYINVWHCKTVQNLPKLVFFGLKIYHLATLILSACPFCLSAKAVEEICNDFSRVPIGGFRRIYRIGLKTTGSIRQITLTEAKGEKRRFTSRLTDPQAEERKSWIVSEISVIQLVVFLQESLIKAYLHERQIWCRTSKFCVVLHRAGMPSDSQDSLTHKVVIVARQN